MAGEKLGCVNLIERFSKRYKITWDPCYNPKGVPQDKLDNFYAQIACERGTIYPHGATTLAVEVVGRPITAKRLSELDCCQLYLDGGHEKTLLFDVSDFEKVAQIIKPRRRRSLTEAQRQASRERMRQYNARNSRSERSQRAQIDSEPVA